MASSTSPAASRSRTSIPLRGGAWTAGAAAPGLRRIADLAALTGPRWAPGLLTPGPPLEPAPLAFRARALVDPRLAYPGPARPLEPGPLERRPPWRTARPALAGGMYNLADLVRARGRLRAAGIYTPRLANQSIRRLGQSLLLRRPRPAPLERPPVAARPARRGRSANRQARRLSPRRAGRALSASVNSSDTPAIYKAASKRSFGQFHHSR